MGDIWQERPNEGWTLITGTLINYIIGSLLKISSAHVEKFMFFKTLTK